MNNLLALLCVAPLVPDVAGQCVCSHPAAKYEPATNTCRVVTRGPVSGLSGDGTTFVAPDTDNSGSGSDGDRPGHGYGDTNHDHSGPPGQNK